MTLPREFCLWLKGYLEGVIACDCELSTDDIKSLREKLDDVELGLFNAVDGPAPAPAAKEEP